MIFCFLPQRFFIDRLTCFLLYEETPCLSRTFPGRLPVDGTSRRKPDGRRLIPSYACFGLQATQAASLPRCRQKDEYAPCRYEPSTARELLRRYHRKSSPGYPQRHGRKMGNSRMSEFKQIPIGEQRNRSRRQQVNRAPYPIGPLLLPSKEKAQGISHLRRTPNV